MQNASCTMCCLDKFDAETMRRPESCIWVEHAVRRSSKTETVCERLSARVDRRMASTCFEAEETARDLLPLFFGSVTAVLVYEMSPVRL